MPDLDATPAPGSDPIELDVDGQSFVVTRRADAPGTYGFHWISHPASYGFSVSTNASWTPGPDELRQHIPNFLAEIDPGTGYLPD